MDKLLDFFGRHRFATTMTLLFIGLPLCMGLPTGFVILVIIWTVVLTGELKRRSKK